MQKVKTRFAPSPTGYLQIGNVRTALFSWLLAKHAGGTFYVRIEDTDRNRFVEDAESVIFETLSWLGLDWDPSVWHQSERLEVYLAKARELLAKGYAYESDGAIRFRWPDDQKVITAEYFTSDSRKDQRVFDRVAEPSAFEDFVLIKADGYPTYNFAHIIDDHEMGITNVIRGDEFTSSLNKYLKLYEVFGWQPPKFHHVPLIHGTDGKKLSKRAGSKGALSYRDEGYLPEAIANFIALIGWSPKNEAELFFSLDELANAFSLDGIQKSPGVFDEQKLRWMNKQHMANRDSGELLELAEALGSWPRRGVANEEAAFSLALERASTLREVSPNEVSYLFNSPHLNAKDLIENESAESVAVWLEVSQRQLAGIETWSPDRLQGAFTDLRTQLDLAPKQLFPVLRIALTGAEQTPSLWDVAAVLGKEETLARLESAAALVA